MRGWIGGGVAPLALGAATLALCAAPAGAEAAQTTSIGVAFRPERLGAPTTIALSFDVRTPGGGVPSPLTGVDLTYPPNLGLGTSGLGVASCQPAVLERDGPRGCPRDSLMGTGGALARFQIGPEIEQERASIALVAGPSQNGYLTLLVSATGVSPVAARIVMQAVLVPGHLRLAVPLVPSLPGAPDVAVVSVHATLGGDLAYTERVHGRTVTYRPRGVTLPRRCPRGGFRFRATFAFLDDSSSAASAVVRCPRG